MVPGFLWVWIAVNAGNNLANSNETKNYNSLRKKSFRKIFENFAPQIPENISEPQNQSPKIMKTLSITNSISRSPLRSISLFAAVALLLSAGAAFAVPPTKILFASATVSVSENAGNAVVNVRRNGNTNGSSSVQYQTTDGTAIAGFNYTATSGVLTFGVGETNKNITIPIIDRQPVCSRRRSSPPFVANSK